MTIRVRVAAPGVLVCAVACALACSSGPPRVGEPGPKVKDSREQDAYEHVLGQYTAREEVYAGLDTRLLASATYQSGSFREARVRRSAEFLGWPPPVVEQRLQAERAELEGWHDFFLGVHLNDSHYEDFGNRNSIWRIALVTSAGEVTPLKIERVGRANLDLRAFYPYLDDFWVAYRVRFPRTFPNGREVVSGMDKTLLVRIASTLGKAELTFPAR